jgi:guanine deaminase
VSEAERNVRAIRGRLLSFLRAPHGAGDAQSYRYIEDGIVLVKDGRIEAAGPVE